MPLQRLEMGSDYPIDPLRQESTRNPPLALLISSNRTTKPAASFPLFSNSPLRLSGRNSNPRRPCALLRESSQLRLAGYGHFNPGLNFKSKTRKFADFSADEKVMMVRGIPTSLASQYPRRKTVPNNIYVTISFLFYQHDSSHKKPASRRRQVPRTPIFLRPFHIVGPETLRSTLRLRAVNIPRPYQHLRNYSTAQNPIRRLPTGFRQ